MKIAQTKKERKTLDTSSDNLPTYVAFKFNGQNHTVAHLKKSEGSVALFVFLLPQGKRVGWPFVQIQKSVQH